MRLFQLNTTTIDVPVSRDVTPAFVAVVAVAVPTHSSRSRSAGSEMA